MTDRNDDSAVDAFLSAHSPVESGVRFAVGTVVGDWRLTGFLGRGGSSEVYRAVHVASSAVAAVKILVRDDAVARTRFAREARFISTGKYAVFLRCVGVGEHEGLPFVVTELLEPVELPQTDSAVADYFSRLRAAREFSMRRVWFIATSSRRMSCGARTAISS